MLNLSFWLNTRPGDLSGDAKKIIYVFLALLIIMGIISFLRARKKVKAEWRIWNKVFNFSLSNIIIGLLLLFFSFELTPVLSMRFFYLLWIILMAVWLFFIFKNYKKITSIKEELIKKQNYNKYIPQKKN